MKSLVPGDAVLCSDSPNGYRNVTAACGIEHFVVRSNPGTRVTSDCYHIQNVNSLHARYKLFIKPFCGPATKNPSGYIRWLEARLAGMRPAKMSARILNQVSRGDLLRAGFDRPCALHEWLRPIGFCRSCAGGSL